MHPVGTVLGNNEYKDYLVVLQNVTVEGGYSFHSDKGMFLGSGAKIIGGGNFGKRVSIGAGVIIRKGFVADDNICFQENISGAIKTQMRGIGQCCAAQKYFKDDLSRL